MGHGQRIREVSRLRRPIPQALALGGSGPSYRDLCVGLPDVLMCNLYSMTKNQAAIIALARAMHDTTGNLPTLPGIFPDYKPPVVANKPGGIRELCMMRWGMPSSQKAQIDAATKRARQTPRQRQAGRF